jgi:hypothetical protein
LLFIGHGIHVLLSIHLVDARGVLHTASPTLADILTRSRRQCVGAQPIAASEFRDLDVNARHAASSRNEPRVIEWDAGRKLVRPDGSYVAIIRRHALPSLQLVSNDIARHPGDDRSPASSFVALSSGARVTCV